MTPNSAHETRLTEGYLHLGVWLGIVRSIPAFVQLGLRLSSVVLRHPELLTDHDHRRRSADACARGADFGEGISRPLHSQHRLGEMAKSLDVGIDGHTCWLRHQRVRRLVACVYARGGSLGHQVSKNSDVL